MRILTLVLGLFIMSSLSASEFRAQNNDTYPLWNGLEAGSHQVGFKVINYWDESRNRTNGTGSERFFPIQISVWYPTNISWSTEKAMPFNEYFYLTEQKNDFKALSAEQKDKAMDIFFNFTNYGAKIELTKEDLAEIGNTATAVMRDAKPIKEQFPVIIAGHDGGVWKGTTLNEFLASHGYVVISTGLLSETSSMLSNNPQRALQRRIRTFEVVREMLDDFEFIDNSKIGLLGINADGMAAMLYQMKNAEADVLINIDGWDGKNNGYNYVSSSPYFDTQSFTIPFMEFHQHEETDREPLLLNQTIFQALNTEQKFSYVITDFGHADLTGNTIAVPGLSAKIVERYDFMFNSILGFYNQYLKEVKPDQYKELEKPSAFFQRAEGSK